MTTYEAAGVRRDLGDAASRMMYEAAQKTWANREGRFGEVIVPLDDFSGLRAMDVSLLPVGTMLNLGFDGVGTKVELAERMGQHHTMAFDLFAMVCDDAVIRGAEPVLIGSILDLNALADDTGDFLGQIAALADGYVKAAAAAGVAVVNGELAELGQRIGGHGAFRYNWGASVLWFAHRDRILTGHQIKPGDAIIGLAEPGFRSNGLSLVRRVLAEQWGEHWHHQVFQGESLGTLALQPSRIYAKAIVAMTGGLSGPVGATIHGAAHITGGGLPGKLGRLLRAAKCGAMISNPLPPSALSLACQRWGQISDREAYQTWNMGQGMVVVTPSPSQVLELAAAHGHSAAQIGEIVDDQAIEIVSQGALSTGTTLHFALD